jgi:hypothetical protein
LVLHQVDDVPVVSPESSGWCEQISNNYKDLCSLVNVELAENCPKNKKAFENQKRGKVLGILFGSTDLPWSIPFSKLRKTLIGIVNVVLNPVVKLNDMQKLKGRLNHIAQMCKFMKIFTHPLNESFKDIPSDAPPDTVVKISKQGFEDLKCGWVSCKVASNGFQSRKIQYCHP